MLTIEATCFHYHIIFVNDSLAPYWLIQMVVFKFHPQPLKIKLLYIYIVDPYDDKLKILLISTWTQVIRIDENFIISQHQTMDARRSHPPTNHVQSQIHYM